MEERVSCPFCGSVKLKIDQKTSGRGKFNPETKRMDKLVVVTVRCNKCHARGPTTSIYVDTWRMDPTKLLEEQAIAAWNRRV